MFCEKITFVIFTYNEEARIERAIKNFSGVAKVLVVDNMSSDRTVELATAAGATILPHKNPGWVEDEDTVAVVKAAVTTPWIYWAYADEMIDAPTLAAVIKAVEEKEFEIIRMARKNYYYGAFCHDAYASPMNRAFKLHAIDFTGNTIHNFGRAVVPESSILDLDSKKYFVHHFISNNAKTYLRTIDSYTDIQAPKTPPKGVGGLVFRTVKSFLVNYLVRGGFRAGLPGLFMGFQMAYYEVLLNMKAYEIDKRLTSVEIESKNNKVRDALLADIL
jgi:glycosyltransferase involved in cell wall biosynthesis